MWKNYVAEAPSDPHLCEMEIIAVDAHGAANLCLPNQQFASLFGRLFAGSSLCASLKKIGIRLDDNDTS